jgi:hypothetical protein
MKQRSSAILACQGSSSLIHAPPWPYCCELENGGRERKSLLAGGHAREAFALLFEPVLEVFLEAGSQAGFVIEKVQLRGRADERDINGAFGFWGDAPDAFRGGIALRISKGAGAEQRGESRDAEAAGAFAEKLAARERGVELVKDGHPLRVNHIHGNAHLVRDSSKLRISLATRVQAAHSAGGMFAFALESPTASRARAPAELDW